MFFEMKRNFVFLVGLSIVLSGCSNWIAPEYTDVSKLSHLKIGMSIDEVNSILGILPYDLYFNQGNNDIVAIYNYRKLERVQKVNDSWYFIHSEASQRSGKLIYKDPSFCYIYFKNDKLKSLTTELGKKKGEIILVKNNNITVLNRSDISKSVNHNGTIFKSVD